jgi:hypothetical protein
VNESTPMDQRAPERTTELSDGPKLVIHGGISQYLPAKYEVVHTIEDKNGNPREYKMIREDR